jgi:hypothetical protein
MRPTKYNKDLVDKARQYVETYEEHGHAFPSLVGLADVIDIHTTTLAKWAREEGKEELSCILDAINRKQQLVAWNKGLTGQYNANLVKLLLGKHGYSEKAQVDSISSDGSLHPTKIVIISGNDEK